MKYIKKYEDKSSDLNEDDYVRIKETGEIGIIDSIITNYSFKSVIYQIDINNQPVLKSKKDIEKLTQEEKELYINMNKYNL